MPAEKGAAKQLRLIRETVDALAAASIPCWLRGGWAVDFFLGEITRPHDDVDLFAWATDGERLAACLVQAGFEEIRGPPSEAQRNFAKEGELFHVVLLDRTGHGKLVTRGGRWGADGEETEEWPDGMLDGLPGRIGDVVAPMVTPAALLHAIEAAALIPGRPREKKYVHDVERLRAALGF